MKPIKFPARYIPKNISRKDKKKQLGMLLKSKRMYKNKKYFTRKRFHHIKTRNQTIYQMLEKYTTLKTLHRMKN